MASGGTKKINMKTNLIADSGSTKTDWCLTHDGTPVCQVRTKGLNPFQMTAEEIEQEIRETLLPHLPTTEVDALYFYGAGCTPEKQPIVEQSLRHCLTITGRCEVATRRDGKWVYYRIASEDALAILGTLHQIYCA